MVNFSKALALCEEGGQLLEEVALDLGNNEFQGSPIGQILVAKGLGK